MNLSKVSFHELLILRSTLHDLETRATINKQSFLRQQLKIAYLTLDAQVIKPAIDDGEIL